MRAVLPLLMAFLLMLPAGFSLDGFAYKKYIVFYGFNETVNNPAILFEPDLKKLTGGNISGCNEIRFVIYRGGMEQVLSHYVETCAPRSNTPSKIWIKYPGRVSPGENISVVMYYGNPNAPDISDKSVLSLRTIYQDDFSSSETYGLCCYLGKGSVSGGKLVMDGTTCMEKDLNLNGFGFLEVSEYEPSSSDTDNGRKFCGKDNIIGHGALIAGKLNLLHRGGTDSKYNIRFGSFQSSGRFTLRLIHYNDNWAGTAYLDYVKVYSCDNCIASRFEASDKPYELKIFIFDTSRNRYEDYGDVFVNPNSRVRMKVRVKSFVSYSFRAADFKAGLFRAEPVDRNFNDFGGLSSNITSLQIAKIGSGCNATGSGFSPGSLIVVTCEFENKKAFFENGEFLYPTASLKFRDEKVVSEPEKWSTPNLNTRVWPSSWERNISLTVSTLSRDYNFYESGDGASEHIRLASYSGKRYINFYAGDWHDSVSGTKASATFFVTLNITTTAPSILIADWVVYGNWKVYVDSNFRLKVYDSDHGKVLLSKEKWNFLEKEYIPGTFEASQVLQPGKHKLTIEVSSNGFTSFQYFLSFTLKGSKGHGLRAYNFKKITPRCGYHIVDKKGEEKINNKGGPTEIRGVPCTSEEGRYIIIEKHYQMVNDVFKELTTWLDQYEFIGPEGYGFCAVEGKLAKGRSAYKEYRTKTCEKDAGEENCKAGPVKLKSSAGWGIDAVLGGWKEVNYTCSSGKCQYVKMIAKSTSSIWEIHRSKVTWNCDSQNCSEFRIPEAKDIPGGGFTCYLSDCTERIPPAISNAVTSSEMGGIAFVNIIGFCPRGTVCAWNGGCCPPPNDLYCAGSCYKSSETLCCNNTPVPMSEIGFFDGKTWRATGKEAICSSAQRPKEHPPYIKAEIVKASPPAALVCTVNGLNFYKKVPEVRTCGTESCYDPSAYQYCADPKTSDVKAKTGAYCDEASGIDCEGGGICKVRCCAPGVVPGENEVCDESGMAIKKWQDVNICPPIEISISPGYVEARPGETVTFNVTLINRLPFNYTVIVNDPELYEYSEGNLTARKDWDYTVKKYVSEEGEEVRMGRHSLKEKLGPQQVKRYTLTVVVPPAEEYYIVNVSATGSFVWDAALVRVLSPFYYISVKQGYAQNADGTPAEGVPVYMYICKPDVLYCKEESPWLYRNETVSGPGGVFDISLNVTLVKNRWYKVSVVTEKGYAETVIRV